MNFYEVFAVIVSIVLAIIFFAFIYRLNRFLDKFSPED